ncbi:protein phosphatase 1 regulatory subunit 35 isoform X2 [Hemicordylus capensis]|uniref:protein phosphatase 1 regulatory subunit 35 isoform X2 n=1 Tax=Hemicordylus capensis TaxID=884348 RepID=UPI002303A8ED|nr:protein phosphatase 1 regulatory subunit 35 isoform X2 [Hemicordylus capensis]
MAATPCGDERDSLPAAAPMPLPQSQRLVPDPQVMLTPERDSAAAARGGGGGGILRRPQQGKIPCRQVRFKLGSKSDTVQESSRERPERAKEAPGVSGGPPHFTGPPKGEPTGGAAADAWQQPPSTLAAPVPHSTLALGAEVQALRAEGFNARQAAEDLVQRSFVARCVVEARVGEGMNIPRDQQLYQGLVSLEVPEDELLNSAVQEKLVLVRSRPEARKPDPAGPDLLAFYDPQELFTETPFLEVEGLPPLKLQPRARDPAATFLMYRKLQQWDS